MAPQRIVSIQQSVRILKYFWWTLNIGPDGVTCDYFTKPQAEVTAKATAYNLQECIDWVPPYTKGVGKLKVILKCIKTYLSRGNVKGPLDAWIVARDGDDPGDRAQFEDTVTISIN